MKTIPEPVDSLHKHFLFFSRIF